MAPSLAECDAILAAADRGGAVLSVVAQNRFTNPMMRLKQVLDSGLAGRVLHAQVDSHWWRGPSYYDLWWRGTWQSEGGGCTLNHAVHHIDALQWMVGTPVAIQAMIANVDHGNSEVEDLSLAILRFPDGALGQITASVVHHGQDQQIIFQTERAKIAMPWTVSAQAQQPNGFSRRQRDVATERSLDDFYQSLPELHPRGPRGPDRRRADRAGNDQRVASRASRRPRGPRYDRDHHRDLPGGDHRADGAAAAAARRPFLTRDGLLPAAPRYNGKKASVGWFSAGEITT